MTRIGTIGRLTLGWAAVTIGVAVFGFTAGCAKKKSTGEPVTDEKTTVAQKSGERTSAKTAKSVAEHEPAKKTSEPSTGKKTVKKTTDPVAKSKPKKKKSDELVPIEQVDSREAAYAHIRGLNPEITTNVSGDIRKLNFTGTDVTDKHLSLLKFFRVLASVNLTGTAITDKGLAHFNKKDLPFLYELNLTGTKITDAGMVHLKGLTRLSELYLYDTGIGDAGVKNLSGLNRLEQLCLDRTRITDKGVAAVKDLTELWRLHIRSRNKITNAGLAHLTGLKQLKELHIQGTDFTEDGVKALRRALPGCNVDWDRTPSHMDTERDGPKKKKGKTP